MIEIAENQLPEQQAREMQTWMSRPPMKTFESVLKSMITFKELEYLSASAQSKKFDNKAGQAETLLAEIVRLKGFLDLFYQVRDQREPFKIAVPANPR